MNMRIPHDDFKLLPMRPDAGPLFSSQPKAIISRFLRINDDPDHFFLTELSEAEGLRQLQQLTTLAQIPEAWAYVPNQETWIEIGDRGGEINTQRINQIISETDILHIYILRTKAASQILNAIPDAENLTDMIATTFAQRVMQPKGQISFSIVSSMGTTQYGLTDYSTRALASIPLTNTCEGVGLLVATAIKTQGGNPLEPPVDQIRRIANFLSADNLFSITFQPF